MVKQSTKLIGCSGCKSELKDWGEEDYAPIIGSSKETV